MSASTRAERGCSNTAWCSAPHCHVAGSVRGASQIRRQPRRASRPAREPALRVQPSAVPFAAPEAPGWRRRCPRDRRPTLAPRPGRRPGAGGRRTTPRTRRPRRCRPARARPTAGANRGLAPRSAAGHSGRSAAPDALRGHRRDVELVGTGVLEAMGRGRPATGAVGGRGSRRSTRSPRPWPRRDGRRGCCARWPSSRSQPSD